MRNISLGIVLTLLFAQVGSSNAAAQPAKARGTARVPATILLSDRLPAGTRFVVKRFPAAARHDVIVLATDATEAELGAAVRTLLTVRQMEGDVPTAKRTLRIRPTTANLDGRPPFPWIGRVLADARRANAVELEEVGTGRAIQIWLPSQRRSRTSPSKPPA